MKAASLLSLVVASLIWVGPMAAPNDAQDKQPPTVKIPNAGVPQIMTTGGNVCSRRLQQRGLCDPRI